jgi:TRAP-type C4-dicarboxylate transport system permease small subunit
VSALICGLLTFAGWTFVQNEAHMAGTTFLEIPVWIPEVIIPITFALMALRYGFRALAEFVIIFNFGHSSQNGSHP